jgi:hypothetical protein
LKNFKNFNSPTVWLLFSKITLLIFILASQHSLRFTFQFSPVIFETLLKMWYYFSWLNFFWFSKKINHKYSKHLYDCFHFLNTQRKKFNKIFFLYDFSFQMAARVNIFLENSFVEFVIWTNFYTYRIRSDI